jgi:transposase
LDRRVVGDSQKAKSLRVWGCQQHWQGGKDAGPFIAGLEGSLDGGGGRRQFGPAERFGVSESTAIRWAQRWRAEGEARARPMGGDHRSRLTGHREAVLTLVAHQPDLTLAEIRAELAARHGLAVGQTTIWRFFERHKITVKKKSARCRAGAA